MSYVPFFRYASVGVGGVTVDFTGVGVMGAAMLINKSPGAVWFNFTAVPPAASFGNGRKQLAQNESVNLDNIRYTAISLRAAAGASDVEIIAIIRPGPSQGEL
jgi:hypothetical protein